jgi:hypothetical protein
MYDDEPPIVPPPATFTVDDKPERKPLLYLADGRPLARDQTIGFRTAPIGREGGGR